MAKNVKKTAQKGKGKSDYMPTGRVIGAEEILKHVTAGNNKTHTIKRTKVDELTGGYASKGIWYIEKFGAEFERIREGREIVAFKMLKAPTHALPGYRESRAELAAYKPAKKTARNRAKKTAAVSEAA